MLETISATQAKDDFINLIEETAESHRPILIKSEKNNAVLISEEDWNSIQETLYLQSVPQMRESIIEGLKAKNEDFLSERKF